MGKSARIAVAPKQSLGQNFLVDDNIARNIVRDLHLDGQDIVVEIGPGQGALTRQLAPHVSRLIAMEIDQRVIEALQQELGSDKVTILRQDFLAAELSKVSSEYRKRLRVVGNIPYHLTSPILFKVFEEHQAVTDLTIMVQKEVARRIVAGPGTKEYGILSVFSRFYGVPRKLFDVSPNCFYPKPNVTSTVIQISMHPLLPELDIPLFSKVVRTTFGKRRKVLRNSLKDLPYDDEVLQRIIGNSKISLDRRPEELTMEEFITLTNDIQHSIG
ncbi:MAG TPA: 16S rRNA (adenine(1518)-N(6)/adenine(1519)-N(6))-dimethyltransferase RsmA [Bacteroidota bacterium]|jgi:16S rRNA (adenine1518-N6/adenine1519-N6)-dimethyltransferase|nr:16S rRNA (adenine(1518)-N(6)/adenine(1519)-N(6))-dimethyltransferase RsmA [Bacteroidota bacterium]